MESKNLRKSDRIGQKICVICEICVALSNSRPTRPQRNLCESVESVGQELVQNVKVS